MIKQQVLKAVFLAYAELLTEASRHAMVEMVHLIFSQLEFLQDSQAVTPVAGHQYASRLQVGLQRVPIILIQHTCNP